MCTCTCVEEQEHLAYCRSADARAYTRPVRQEFCSIYMMFFTGAEGLSALEGTPRDAGAGLAAKRGGLGAGIGSRSTRVAIPGRRSDV